MRVLSLPWSINDICEKVHIVYCKPFGTVWKNGYRSKLCFLKEDLPHTLSFQTFQRVLAIKIEKWRNFEINLDVTKDFHDGFTTRRCNKLPQSLWSHSVQRKIQWNFIATFSKIWKICAPCTHFRFLTTFRKRNPNRKRQIAKISLNKRMRCKRRKCDLQWTCSWSTNSRCCCRSPTCESRSKSY